MAVSNNSLPRQFTRPDVRTDDEVPRLAAEQRWTPCLAVALTDSTASPSPGIGASWSGDTTRQLNTHNLGSCEVHYPWHPWYGRTLWVYGTRAGRAQAAARCGLEPTQGSKSLEVPVWVLETTSCATMRLAESPQVDCVALQSLKTLLYDSVLQDRV